MVSNDEVDGLPEAAPFLGECSKSGLACRGDVVVAARGSTRGLLPGSGHEVAFSESRQERVQRPFALEESSFAQRSSQVETIGRLLGDDGEDTWFESAAAQLPYEVNSVRFHAPQGSTLRQDLFGVG